MNNLKFVIAIIVSIIIGFGAGYFVFYTPQPLPVNMIIDGNNVTIENPPTFGDLTIKHNATLIVPEGTTINANTVNIGSAIVLDGGRIICGSLVRNASSIMCLPYTDTASIRTTATAIEPGGGGYVYTGGEYIRAPGVEGNPLKIIIINSTKKISGGE